MSVFQSADLFAAQGASRRCRLARVCSFINTLSESQARELDWTNRAAHRTAIIGGGRLIQDLMLPHLTGSGWQAANGDELS